MSRPTILNLYLTKDRKWLEIEDAPKVEAGLLRVKGTAEVLGLDSKGTLTVFTDYGEL